MICRLRLVLDDVCRTIVCRDYQVLEAIVVEVADGKPASGPRLLKDCAGSCRNVHELAMPRVSQEQQGFFVVKLRESQLNVIDVMAPARRLCPSIHRCRSRKTLCHQPECNMVAIPSPEMWLA